MRARQPQVVASGIPFGEGPVWCPDATLVVTSVTEGALYRIEPATGDTHRIAETGGGANGAVLAADGGFVVTQNGGFDFAATGLFDDPPPFHPATPGLQRVHPDGTVAYLTDEPLQAPNDLAVGPDGAIWFTDPGPFPPPEPTVARVLRWTPGTGTEVVADGFWYVNGIAVEPDGGLVVVERRGLLRIGAPGAGQEHRWVIEDLGEGGGDGFCLDADGRFYVCSTIARVVIVVEPDGTVAERLEVAEGRMLTNCCFGGDDLRTLFATDAVAGTVLAWEGMPAPGLPLPTWDVP